MKVAYHAAVQQDVNRALRRYDKLSGRLGDEFWHELTTRIKAAAANPLRFHPSLLAFPNQFASRQIEEHDEH